MGLRPGMHAVPQHGLSLSLPQKGVLTWTRRWQGDPRPETLAHQAPSSQWAAPASQGPPRACAAAAGLAGSARSCSHELMHEVHKLCPAAAPGAFASPVSQLAPGHAQTSASPEAQCELEHAVQRQPRAHQSLVRSVATVQGRFVTSSGTWMPDSCKNLCNLGLGIGSAKLQLAGLDSASPILGRLPQWSQKELRVEQGQPVLEAAPHALRCHALKARVQRSSAAAVMQLQNRLVDCWVWTAVAHLRD